MSTILSTTLPSLHSRAVFVVALVLIFGLQAMPTDLLPQAYAQDNAVALFEQGEQLFHDKKYREAIKIFSQVFSLDPNPFVLFNIARCYQELNNLEEAVRYYDRSLKIKGLPEEAKIEALKRIQLLTPKLEKIEQRRNAVAEAVIRVDRSFYVAQNEARNKATSNVNTDPVAPPPPGRTVWTWIGTGTAALGAIALGSGFFIDAGIGDKLDQQDELITSYIALGNEAIAENNPTKALAARNSANEVNTLADEIESDQLSSGLLLGVGAAFLAGGIVMIVLDTPSKQPQATEPSGDVRIVPSPGGIGVHTQW